MLKTSSTKSAKPKKGGTGVGSFSKAGRDGNELDRSEMDDVEVNGGKVGNDKIGKKC